MTKAPQGGPRSAESNLGEDESDRREESSTPARSYYSTSEMAAAMGVSRQRIHELCRNGQIQGAKQSWPGGPWLIPANPVVVRKRRYPAPKK
jgi:hypothetical protein